MTCSSQTIFSFPKLSISEYFLILCWYILTEIEWNRRTLLAPSFSPFNPSELYSYTSFLGLAYHALKLIVSFTFVIICLCVYIYVSQELWLHFCCWCAYGFRVKQFALAKLKWAHPWERLISLLYKVIKVINCPTFSLIIMISFNHSM